MSVLEAVADFLWAISPSEPAKVIGHSLGLGTLQTGALADVESFDVVDGPAECVDTMKNIHTGTKTLVFFLAHSAGKRWSL